MTRALRTTLAAGAVAVVLIPSLALAQPGGGRGFRGGPGGAGGGVLGLLQREEVQQEVQLVDEQQTQLRELADDIRSQMRDVFEQMRDVPREERRARFDEIRAAAEKIRTDAEARLQTVLLPHQLERLKQIELQSRLQQNGAAALNDGELADSLGLTAEQQERLRQRAEELQQEMQQKIVQLRAEAREKLLQELTPEQRAKLESMLGDQFELPDRGPRGRGIGGRAGQRGGQPPAPADQPQ